MGEHMGIVRHITRVFRPRNYQRVRGETISEFTALGRESGEGFAIEDSQGITPTTKAFLDYRARDYVYNRTIVFNGRTLNVYVMRWPTPPS